MLGELRPFADSWRLHLRAERKSPMTVRLYLGTLDDLARFLRRAGMPTDITAISGEHLREYLADQFTRGLSAKTVHSRHGFLNVFFGWCIAEGEITHNPMAKIKAPRLDETAPAIVTDEQFAAMLKTCAGRGTDDRRDAAILRLLESTGIRRAECAGLQVDGLHLPDMTVTVMGKGRYGRTVPFDAETAVAIDRYMRERAKRRYARSGALFLARTGPMSPNAIGDVVYRRARLAGLVDGSGHELVSPHMFRHRFADRWKREGGTEDSLMSLGGWHSRAMMERYGRANRASRAIEEYRRLRSGER